jgi:hypothetical protein
MVSVPSFGEVICDIKNNFWDFNLLQRTAFSTFFCGRNFLRIFAFGIIYVEGLGPARLLLCCLNTCDITWMWNVASGPAERQRESVYGVIWTVTRRNTRAQAELHSEERHSVFRVTEWKMIWARHIARSVEVRIAYSILVGKILRTLTTPRLNPDYIFARIGESLLWGLTARTCVFSSLSRLGQLWGPAGVKHQQFLMPSLTFVKLYLHLSYTTSCRVAW